MIYTCGDVGCENRGCLGKRGSHTVSESTFIRFKSSYYDVLLWEEYLTENFKIHSKEFTRRSGFLSRMWFMIFHRVSKLSWVT